MLHAHYPAFAHKVSTFASLMADHQEQNQWAACFTPVSQGIFPFVARLCADPESKMAVWMPG